MASVVFLGTPNFGATILEGLIKDNYQALTVVTQSDKKVGRKRKLTSSPVKEMVQKYDLPVYQPVCLPRSEELDTLINLYTDLTITATHERFLPAKFLKGAKIATVNARGSFLPEYRDGASIQYSLVNGDEETDVTIMEMVKEVNTGGMYAQGKLPIAPEDTAGSLFEKMAILGRDLLLKTLPSITDDSYGKRAQNTTKVAFSPNANKDQEKITKDMTTSRIHNLIRDLNPDPGTYLMISGRRMKVWSSEVANEATQLPAGTLVDNRKRFVVGFANHAALNLTKIQPTGKKKMAGRDYMNGKSAGLKLGEVFIDDWPSTCCSIGYFDKGI